MKNIFNNKFLKYLICTMIIVQGIFFSLVTSFYIDKSYVNKLSSYPESSLFIELKTIPREKTLPTLRFLQEYAMENGIFYIRKDYRLDKNAYVNGITFGIGGDLEKNKNELTCDFFGANVINYEKIEKLLKSENENAVLGIESSSKDSIASIPSFQYGSNIVFKKLEKIVDDTKTINGEYRIVGLDKSMEADFLLGLSKASGVDSRVFFDGKSGYSLDDSFKEMIIIGLFVAYTFILLALLVVITINSLPNLGRYILQGWSRWKFALRLYRPMIYTGIISIFLFIIYGLLLTNMSFNSIRFYSVMLGLGGLHLLILVALILIASLFIFFIKPVDLIKDRFPKKRYIIVTLLVYIVFNVLLVMVISYIDGAFKEIKNNVEISKKWEEVSDYKVISSISVGQDTASFNRQSKIFSEDFYNWYKSIADDKNVILVNTTHITKEMLNTYRIHNTYKYIPNEEFWVFRVSPTYLKKLGVDVDTDLIEKAKSGVRVYLIPESKSESETKLIKGMINEDDTKGIRADDIDTVFNREKEFYFSKYDFSKDLFSWNTKELDNITINNPVILITTPNNMSFFESESLIANGLQNSYIKLESEAVNKYTDTRYLAKFNLDDNEIEFSSVGEFVDGIQKSLWKTVQLFSIFLIGVTIIIIIVLLTLLTIFQNVYKEKISVKKFLGYSNVAIYKIPIIIVSMVMVVDLLAVIILRSRIGIVYMGIVVLLELFGIYIVISRNQMKRVIELLKS